MKEDTQRVQLTGSQVKVIKKAVKSTQAAGVFQPKETKEVAIILAKLNK